MLRESVIRQRPPLLRLTETEESKRPVESKADLDWAVGLGKLKEVEVGDMGYCNSCREMGGGIGGACRRCKGRLV